MTDFKNANLAIEYRPEIKALEEKISILPEEFQTRFYEVLSEQPRIDASELESIIFGEYHRWLDPYESSDLNDALKDIRSLGPKAEQDFKDVIEKLGTSVSCEKVVEKIKEKYAQVDLVNVKGAELSDVNFSGRKVFDSEPKDELNLNTDSTDKVDSFVSKVNGLKTNKDGWIFDHVVPWRRYAARMLDITFNGLIIWMLIGLAAYQIAPYEADQLFDNIDPIFDMIATAFFGCLSTGILLGFTGTTIGKWIFGIRVIGLDGKTIGIPAGILRDLSVWIKGLAFGLPLLSLVTLIMSYRDLKNRETTSWDAGQYVVLHRPSGALQYFLNTIGVIILFVTTAIISVLSEM